MSSLQKNGHSWRVTVRLPYPSVPIFVCIMTLTLPTHALGEYLADSSTSTSMEEQIKVNWVDLSGWEGPLFVSKTPTLTGQTKHRASLNRIASFATLDDRWSCEYRCWNTSSLKPWSWFYILEETLMLLATIMEESTFMLRHSGLNTHLGI